MNKSLPLSILLLALPAALSAEVITPQEALQRASSVIPATRSAGNLNQLVYTSRTPQGQPAVYVFGNSNADGALFLSADDVAAPVLGYADSGRFDVQEIPASLKYWLEQYGRQIQYASSNGIAFSAATRSDYPAAIEPLVKTKWDQGTPYDMYTPTINNSHAPTGCTATATAQVMKHWNYPAQGKGTVRVTVEATGKTESLNLAGRAFAWGDMLDVYQSGGYTTQQAEAVGYLMQAVGYASKMAYAEDGSGAYLIDAARGLINNFSYNENIEYLQRDYYTATNWEAALYNELTNGRPVIYEGQSTSVGHAFVCDGYNGAGYYHFNWGWGGMSDGYFLLDALNPDAVGTGGGEGGGYNYGQGMLAGVQPEKTADEYVRLIQWGGFVGRAQGNTFSLTPDNDSGWASPMIREHKLAIGVEIASLDSDTKEYVSIQDVTLKGVSEDWSYYGIFSALKGQFPEGLADGRYKMTVVSKDLETADAPWVPVGATSYYNNFTIFTKTGSVYKFEKPVAPGLTITEAKVLTPLYAGTVAKFSVTVKNTGDSEVTRGVYPVLSAMALGGSSSSFAMTGEGIMVTLQPGETVTREFTSVLQPVDDGDYPTKTTQYMLEFIDPSTQTPYSWNDMVTMNVLTANPTVTITGYKLPDYRNVNTSVNYVGDSFRAMVAQVDDMSKVRFRCTVNCSKGYFASTVYTYIWDMEGNYITGFPMGTPMVNAGESATIDAELDFSNGREGDIYICSASAVLPLGDNQTVDSDAIFFKLLKGSGVEVIEANGNGQIVYDRTAATVTAPASKLTFFTLDGKAVVSATSADDTVTADVRNLPSGVYIVVATTPSGETMFTKIKV